MSKGSREKGRRAEIELCKLLSDELGIEVRRNVDQARSGGADTFDVPGYSIEIKRREMLARPTWWKQACEQAQRVGMEPLVFYRRNREPWRALMTGMGEYRDVSWVEAMDVMRDKLARLYGVFKEAA
jgi:hypothetical protein